MIDWEIFHAGLLPPWVAYSLGAALAAALLALLRRELRPRQRRLRLLLYATRLGMVVLLTLLLAQPNLVRAKRRAQEGGALVLIDDSASMFARDQWTDADSRLALGKLLAMPEMAGYRTPYRQLAEALDQRLEELIGFFAATREARAAIHKGLPWKDASQRRVTHGAVPLRALRSMLETMAAGAQFAPPTKRLAAELAASLGKAGEGKGLMGLASRPQLTQEGWVALATAAADFETTVERLRQRLHQRQLAADQEFLARQGRGEAIAARLRQSSRYQLCQELIAKTPPLAAAAQRNLARGRQKVDAAHAAGQTDLVKPLAAALAERPLELLNAVYLFSDGSQNSRYDLEQLRIYRKRGVKLVLVGVGAKREQARLVLEGYDCPGILPPRTTLPLVLRFRLDLPVDTPVELSLSRLGATAAATPETGDEPRARQISDAQALPFKETIASDGSPRLTRRLRLRLSETGFQTLVLRAEVKALGLKLEQRFGVYVFDQRPKVLLIAPRPDQFCHSVLAQQRLGVRVHALFHYGKKRAALVGGNVKMPASEADWGRYNLVILKDAPFAGLKPEDVAALVGHLRNKGVALWLLGSGADSYFGAFAEALAWPAEGFSALSAASRLTPEEAASHLPLLQLSREPIQNLNLWQEFGAPSQWGRTPEQHFVLFRHPRAGEAAGSLGLYGAGKLLATGLAGFEPMNEWHAPLFDATVTQMLTDLLTPTAAWESETPELGLYPPIGAPGKASVVQYRIDDPANEGVGGWQVEALAFETEGPTTVSRAGLTRDYVVRRPESAETRDLDPRPEFLRQMAAAAGGECIMAPDLGSLPAPAAKTRAVIDSRVTRTADFSVWLLGLFLVLATADFAIRKEIGMVL